MTWILGKKNDLGETPPYIGFGFGFGVPLFDPITFEAQVFLTLGQCTSLVEKHNRSDVEINAVGRPFLPAQALLTAPHFLKHLVKTAVWLPDFIG
ncbi:hypothetical protein CY34DRAFT_19673 [Suillus luteus UH-Slu-Lm8-n1]|uniref:Uncharacterized protein n=1 Tax=Suillus luteus UH-Slu-Lm8-n1 TaxID=930992 RepID=A0A0D0ABQ1_9AGAM|nr:hypothetical protein CY34DRAFT_19673 [Suillus luteus UH-Slu-Lm8-n1]